MLTISTEKRHVDAQRRFYWGRGEARLPVISYRSLAPLPPKVEVLEPLLIMMHCTHARMLVWDMKLYRYAAGRNPVCSVDCV